MYTKIGKEINKILILSLVLTLIIIPSVSLASSVSLKSSSSYVLDTDSNNTLVTLGSTSISVKDPVAVIDNKPVVQTTTTVKEDTKTKDEGLINGSEKFDNSGSPTATEDNNLEKDTYVKRTYSSVVKFIVKLIGLLVFLK